MVFFGATLDQQLVVSNYSQKYLRVFLISCMKVHQYKSRKHRKYVYLIPQLQLHGWSSQVLISPQDSLRNGIIRSSDIRISVMSYHFVHCFPACDITSLWFTHVLPLFLSYEMFLFKVKYNTDQKRLMIFLYTFVFYSLKKCASM